MKTDLEKIRRQLRKMAFGKPNDCVKLAMCEDVDIEKLDLSMLTEIKREELEKFTSGIRQGRLGLFYTAKSGRCSAKFGYGYGG